MQALRLPALCDLGALHKQHHDTLKHGLVAMHPAILCIEADTQQGPYCRDLTACFPCRQKTRLSPSLCILAPHRKNMTCNWTMQLLTL